MASIVRWRTVPTGKSLPNCPIRLKLYAVRRVYMAVCTTAVAYSKAIPTAGTIRFETITIANLPKCRICPGYRKDRHGNKFTLSTLLINHKTQLLKLPAPVLLQLIVLQDY